MLPILIILFIFSYAILTMLVIEQGRTIDSQRALIREMLKDSNQLAVLKQQLAKNEALRLHQKSSNDGSSAPVQQQKDSQGAAKAPKAGKQTHSTKQAPGKPPADLQDVRRLTNII